MNPPNVFCSNPACASRGIVGAGNIIRAGAAHGRQRYECKVCHMSFSETKGSVFYRLRTPSKQVTQMITLLSEGCPPQAIVRAFGFDERTVYAWLLRAGEHAQRVHEHLVSEQPRDLVQVQADEIRVKMQKRALGWMAMAMAVPTRLWLGGVISPHRDTPLIAALVAKIKACALFAPLLLVVDGLAAYVSCLRAAFRTPVWTGKPGRPRLLQWPILIGQVIKRKQKRHVVAVERRLLQGSPEQAQALRPEGQLLHTAYIERLNATFRARLCALVRRGRALARQTRTLQAGMYLVGTLYNFCTPHKSLREERPEGPRKWQPRAPAMAAGITDHLWSVHEVLSFRVPPPPYVPPRRRGRPPKQVPAFALAGGST